jgi:hypothetical protein
MTSAARHELAAAHYENAARRYRLSVACYDEGDYWQASEHATLKARFPPFLKRASPVDQCPPSRLM